MPRRARDVAPNSPHHVTQRGSRRLGVFLEPADYDLYRCVLRDACEKHEVSIWAYCLMPNHVHLVCCPATADGLARAFGEAHQRYSTLINRRERWTGHLWQQRFHSCPLSELHAIRAIRYVLLNPVRAALATTPYEWPHSSARAHRHGTPDVLVDRRPLDARIEDWDGLLTEHSPPTEFEELRRATLYGRFKRFEISIGDPVRRSTRRALAPRSESPATRASQTPRS